MALCEGDHFGRHIPLAQREWQFQRVFVEKTKAFAADPVGLNPVRVKDEQRWRIRPGPQGWVGGAKGFFVNPENRSLQSHGSSR